ncbi:MAG: phosphoribosylaminoimidazolesuccinocarboxamide synthase [Candidatus Margulisiibacteriota bacterium]|nr:phosphoribosylaminoimidazolesuccinocarboxamide synthase [Candidatus Margulisiibacteriota bacterium]
MIKTDVHTQFNFDSLKLFRRGKVRDVFDFGENLLIVSSDRVSAFDSVIERGIPNKGQTLTKISEFWFNKLDKKHHCISTNVNDFPEETKPFHSIMDGRSMLVKKTELIPIECVVRGYIIGSGWKDYQKTGQVCGHTLPEGLQMAQKLETPLFTPASKSFDGHDENISVQQMVDQIGSDLTNQLQELSLSIYNEACDYANERGIIIADTKFEFGLLNGEVIIIDEVLTPDSSRFWAKDSYSVGKSPKSFDKQIVRDYIETTDWDRKSDIPNLPDEIVEKTAAEYEKIVDLLTS